MSNEYVVQTAGAEGYTALFDRALAHGEYDRLEVAVAYATLSGVKILEHILRDGFAQRFDDIDKRWLVGID